jgi:hypothetical protein
VNGTGVIFYKLKRVCTQAFYSVVYVFKAWFSYRQGQKYLIMLAAGTRVSCFLAVLGLLASFTALDAVGVGVGRELLSTWSTETILNRTKRHYNEKMEFLKAKWAQRAGTRDTNPEPAPATPPDNNEDIVNRTYLAANLFILGAQKAGTSSLFAALKKHSSFCAGHKEPHFFHYDHEYAMGKAFYEKYFLQNRLDVVKCTTARISSIPKGTKFSVTTPFANTAPPIGRGYKMRKRHYFMDGSTMLHNMREVAPRIKEFYEQPGTQVKSSELKFIILLREPVARDISCFEHYSRNAIGHVPFRFPQYYLPFAAFGENKGVLTMAELFGGNLTAKMKHQQQFTSLSNYSEVGNGLNHDNDFIRGEYALQIREFLKYFNRSQLMILNSEFVIRHHNEALFAIADFVNLEVNHEMIAFDSAKYPHTDHDIKGSCIHQHVPKLDCSFRDRLASYYRPWNEELMKLLNETRSSAPKSEPPFAPFQPNEYQNVPCVQDARKELNEVIRTVNKDRCDVGGE